MGSIGTGMNGRVQLVQRDSDGRLLEPTNAHTRLRDLFGLHSTYLKDDGIPPRRAAVLRKAPPFYIRRPSLSKQLAMDQRMMAEELRIRLEEEALREHTLGVFAFEEDLIEEEELESEEGFEEVRGRDDAHGGADLFSPLKTTKVASSPWAARPNRRSHPVFQSSFYTVPISSTTPKFSSPPSYALPPLPEVLSSPRRPSHGTIRSRGSSFSTAAFKSLVNLARRKSSVETAAVTEQELKSWRRGSTASTMTVRPYVREAEVFTISIPGSTSWDGVREDGPELDEAEKLQVQRLLEDEDVVVFRGRDADIESSYRFPPTPARKKPSSNSLFDSNYTIRENSSPSTRFRNRSSSPSPPLTPPPGRRPSASRVPVPSLIIPSPKLSGLAPPPRPRKSPSRTLEPTPIPQPPSPRRMISSSAWMQISLSNAPPHPLPSPLPRLRKKSSKRRGLGAAFFVENLKGRGSMLSLAEGEVPLATPPPSPHRETPMGLGLGLEGEERMGTGLVI
jgi:hypothetical protein